MGTGNCVRLYERRRGLVRSARAHHKRFVGTREGGRGKEGEGGEVGGGRGEEGGGGGGEVGR